jgi:hypothetical protein
MSIALFSCAFVALRLLAPDFYSVRTMNTEQRFLLGTPESRGYGIKVS